MTTAILEDLIRVGEFSPAKANLAMDPRKLQWAKDEVLSEGKPQS